MGNFDGLNSLMQKRIDAVPVTLFCYGKITGMNPITVKVEDRFDLPAEGVTVLEGLDLKVGNEVVLIRNHGGQQYLVLGKVKK